MYFNQELVSQLSKGAQILGGGGGGREARGLKTAEEALASGQVRLAGLEEAALYRRRDTGEVRSGAGWMRGGLLIEAVQSDYLSVLAILERV